MTTNIAVDVMVNGARVPVVLALPVDPVTGLPGTGGGGGATAGGATAEAQATIITRLSSILAELLSTTAFSDAGRLAVSQADNFTSVGSIGAVGVVPLVSTTSPGAVVNGVIDTTGYSAIVVQFTGAVPVATAMFQGMNEGGIMNMVTGYSPGTIAAVSQVSNVPNPAPGLTYIIPVTTKYFRINVPAWTSGVIAASVTLRTNYVPQQDPQAAAKPVTLGAGIAVAGSVVQAAPLAGGLLTLQARVVAAATTNPTLVKTGASTVMGYRFTNTATTPAWVRLGNTAAAPVPGTTVALDVIALAPGATVVFHPSQGVSNYPLGLSYWITAGSALDADTTVLAAAGTVTGAIVYR